MKVLVEQLPDGTRTGDKNDKLPHHQWPSAGFLKVCQLLLHTYSNAVGVIMALWCIFNPQSLRLGLVSMAGSFKHTPLTY